MTLVESAAAVKTVATAAVGAAVASAAAPIPPEPSLWGLFVLGIPLSVLAASMVGAGIRHLREPPVPEHKMAAKVIATACDAMIGGWLAMLVMGLPITSGHVGTAVRPEVIGAICALSVQYLRARAAEWGDTLVRNVLSWLGKRGTQ